MKCVECGRDSKKKDRDSNHGRCPACFHSFVADPSEDGLTDMAIRNAENIVSAHNTFYFTKQQFIYQLQRLLRKKQRIALIVAMIAGLAFLGLLVTGLVLDNFLFTLSFFSLLPLLIALAARAKFGKHIGKLETLVEKWVLVNPHDKLLTTQKYPSNFNMQSTHLNDVSFDRVLICDRNETVDFFLSNLFHFHYSCPVLGGNRYPASICDDMLRRLKQNPNVKVFLLHDYSPTGYAFVRKIKTDPAWFGGQRYNIVDLGLNVVQKPMFKAMTIKHIDRNRKIKETAEVALFQPATLVALCGAAINEGVPLDLVKTVAAATSSSSDGYG